MGHRFMFIDGDKAVSGSYSFTWMSSRLDRNLITVTTGQAVDAFDQLFRFLYMTSSCVDLQQVAMEPEPEPELRPQIPTVAPTSADVARKLFNPKYALVALTNPSPTTSIGRDTPKEPEIVENSKKTRRKKASVEAKLPLHPGLTNLEKACLITYLPTWPEPDPPSDVIGFINIRDASKPTQVHLQRSEMFETSQAIRFSSPISRPQETLPEVARPRQLAAKHEEENKLEQSKSKGEELVEDRAKPAQLSVVPDDIKSKDKALDQKSPPCRLKSEPSKDKTNALKTENKLYSSTKPGAGHNTDYLNAHTLPQSSYKAFTPLHTTQTVSTNSPKSNSHLKTNSKKEAETVASLNIKSAVVNRAHTLESNSTPASHQPDPGDSKNTDDTQEQTLMLQRDSQTKAVNMQPDISSEMTHNLKTPSIHKHISTASASEMQSKSSTFLSKNSLITTVHSSTATSSCTSVSSTSSPSVCPSPVSSVTTLNSPLPSSSPSASSLLASGPPIPKLRTFNLVFKDSSISNNQMLPEICLVRRPKTCSVPEMVLNEVAVATMLPASPAKELESAPERQSNGASKTGDEIYTGNTNNPTETSQQKLNVTSQEREGKGANGEHDGRAGSQSVIETKLQTQSDVFITDTPKTASLNIKEKTPKDADSKTLSSETETTSAAIAQAKTSENTPNIEFAQVPNVTQNQTHLGSHEPQRVSYSKLTPKNINLLEAMDYFNAPVQYTSQKPCTAMDSADDSMHMSVADKLSELGNQAQVISGHCTNSILDTVNHNIDGTIQKQTCETCENTQTPKKSLHLQVSPQNMSDLFSPTSERESWSPTAVRTPSPDGFPQRPPTPDSRTTTPDSRSYIPEFLTPTSDISDGYISPREDSTTSEEYYECSESPIYEPVFDPCEYQNQGTKQNHISLTQASTPTTATNPACLNYSLDAATLYSADQDTSCSETQTLSCTSGVSVSSLIETKGQKIEMEDTSEEIEGEEDINGEKLSHAKKRTEHESQGIERASSDEASRMVEHFKQEDYSTETAVEGSEAQALKRKRVQNQSAPDRLFDEGLSAGESTCQETELKQLSTGDFKPKTVSSESTKPDKALKALNQSALRPSKVERTESQSAREAKEQKQLQQQDVGPSTSSRPLRSPRSRSASQLLGDRPSESREPNQTESKLLLSSLKGLDNVSSPHKPPSQQSPPVTVGVVPPAAGRKQISLSQQSFNSQQPPAAHIRTRAGQPQSQAPYPKPQPSFLYTYSNLQPQVHPLPQTQMESTQEAHEQEQGRLPFNLSFSRLYSIKGSKDKMSKLPVQSKRGSPPKKGRKSSS
ncbi:mucin-5AC-like isoform X2 [Melanotaenia boesemani]|nr:mucin-5AC-like isoform X2 [Melanotaenia boesemani]